MSYEANSNRWYTWRVSGTEDQISALLDALDASLPAGWSRIQEDELKGHARMSRGSLQWYRLEPPDDYAGGLLSVERPSPSELRGGPCMFAGWSSIDIPPTWDRVNRFLDEGAIKFASQVGAKIYDPTLEELFFSELPFDTKLKLQRFSDKARKQLPLDRKEAESWDAFVVAAFREQASVADNSFVNWLVWSGWSEELATDLVERFFENRRLLSHYRAELVIV